MHVFPPQKTVYGASVIIFEGIMAFADKELLQVGRGYCPLTGPRAALGSVQGAGVKLMFFFPCGWGLSLKLSPLQLISIICDLILHSRLPSSFQQIEEKEMSFSFVSSKCL